MDPRALPPLPEGLPFTGPSLLAPMEGVTEPCYRDLVLSLHDPRELGGATTEFARVVDGPLPVRTLAEHLGPARHPMPVALQLMGSNLDALAETARRAYQAGADLVDLNFGCPSKGALRGCAGSALLDDPARLERVVRVVTDAVAPRRVTAKIRAGGDDDRLLEDLARAAEQGGAALLTVHCRTRAEAYADSADWRRLERAVTAVAIPICGNGGVQEHGDLERMRRATGCALAMVGRAALGDPWIFSGRRVAAWEAADFLLEYAARLMVRGGARPAGAAGRVKQLLGHWTAGGLVGADRTSWLRETDPERLFARLWQVRREALRAGEPGVDSAGDPILGFPSGLAERILSAPEPGPDRAGRPDPAPLSAGTA